MKCVHMPLTAFISSALVWSVVDRLFRKAVESKFRKKYSELALCTIQLLMNGAVLALVAFLTKSSDWRIFVDLLVVFGISVAIELAGFMLINGDDDHLEGSAIFFLMLFVVAFLNLVYNIMFQCNDAAL